MPKPEPMPEFVLIQRDKKDVVRKLIVKTATMKFAVESRKFSAKVLGIIREGGEQCVRATDFMRGMVHECGHDYDHDHGDEDGEHHGHKHEHAGELVVDL